MIDLFIMIKYQGGNVNLALPMKVVVPQVKSFVAIIATLEQRAFALYVINFFFNGII